MDHEVLGHARLVRTWITAILMACLPASLTEANAGPPVDPTNRVAAQPADGDWPRAPRSSARIFISGHSLTDRPLPDQLAAVADSLETPALWERQYIVGSSIRRRTRGETDAPSVWAGYREGYNRHGEGLDVVAELRRPSVHPDRPYDVLLITEQHGLLGTLIWNDTVRHLRHYHERFIEGNPRGQTYFYESWISLDDKDRPERWIAYERAASPVWQCIATRINVSLQAEGRSDRIVSLPAGRALAELLARALQPPGVPGLSGPTARDAVDRLIKDDVHLTPLGSYYLALVSYAAIYERSPVGAWAPEGTDPALARALQTLAWDFVSGYYRSYRPISLAQCRQYLQDGFIGLYWAYVRDAYWRRETHFLAAYFRWARHLLTWRHRLSRSDERNPFHHDPATDAGHWWAPPGRSQAPSREPGGPGVAAKM